MSRTRILLATALSVVAIGGAGLTAYGIAAAEAPAKEPADGASSSEARPDDSGEDRRGQRRGDPLLTDEEAAAITVDANIVYREVEGDEVLLDVCTAPAAEGPRPAVVLIHGGGFRAGDKDNPQWQAVCRWLADAGYVAVNVNYRLAPEHDFPAAIDDVQAAVEWTRTNADSYGIDPTRIGALGGSAGANLAQLLGTSGDGSTETGSRVGAVVSLSGASDMTERGLDLGEPSSDQVERLLDYLGCSEIANCPAAEAASPITHVDSTDPPFLLAQSRLERLPVQQTEAMADVLTVAGTEPTVVIAPGRAHATRLLTFEHVQDEVLAFLERTLG